MENAGMTRGAADVTYSPNCAALPPVALNSAMICSFQLLIRSGYRHASATTGDHQLGSTPASPSPSRARPHLRGVLLSTSPTERSAPFQVLPDLMRRQLALRPVPSLAISP
jgi:hypothetical protein